MNEILEGKICDGCGRRCPLTNPACGIGIEEAERILNGGERPNVEQLRERRRSKRHSHNEDGHHEHGHHLGSDQHGREHHRNHGNHGHSGKSGSMRGELTENERLSRAMHHCARMLVHREHHQGGQQGMLAILSSHGGMSQARLAEKLNIRSASASELLAKMEAEGLVIRTPDADDGRANRVVLTDAGKEAANAVLAERRKRDETLFSVLDQTEKQQLTALIDKLIHSWR